MYTRQLCKASCRAYAASQAASHGLTVENHLWIISLIHLKARSTHIRPSRAQTKKHSQERHMFPKKFIEKAAEEDHTMIMKDATSAAPKRKIPNPCALYQDHSWHVHIQVDIYSWGNTKICIADPPDNKLKYGGAVNRIRNRHG